MNAKFNLLFSWCEIITCLGHAKFVLQVLTRFRFSENSASRSSPVRLFFHFFKNVRSMFSCSALVASLVLVKYAIVGVQQDGCMYNRVSRAGPSPELHHLHLTGVLRTTGGWIRYNVVFSLGEEISSLLTHFPFFSLTDGVPWGKLLANELSVLDSFIHTSPTTTHQKKENVRRPRRDCYR